MKDTLTGFTVSKLAKSKGFDEVSRFGFLEEDYSKKRVEIEQPMKWLKGRYASTTLSLLDKWLRVKHNIDISIITHYDHKTGERSYRCGIIYINNNIIETLFLRPSKGVFKEVKFIEFESHDLAWEAGLEKGLDLVKLMN